MRIVIADDHCLFRKGLANFISGLPHCILLGEAADGSELISLVENIRPDLVITDIRMPILNGLDATKAIIEKFPETSVLILSMHDSERIICATIAAGASGYLLKNSDPNQIEKAIKTIAQKKIYYASEVYAKLIGLIGQNNLKPKINSIFQHFTELELKVISLICQELSNKQIAIELGLTIRSVESAKERIQKKTGAKNMVGIAMYAMKNELT